MKKLLFLALALATLTARTWGYVLNVDASGQQRHWDLTTGQWFTDPNVVNPDTRAIRFFYGAEAWSAANKTAELNAVRASFAQWQSIPGTLLKFEEAGLVEGITDVNTLDNRNVVFWIKSNPPIVFGGMDNISAATGVTYSDVFVDVNYFAEADVVLNGANFEWFTDINNTSTAAQFIESVLLHEIGHVIGLDHSAIGGATMLARGGNGINVQTGLSSDDVSAALALYPTPARDTTQGTLRGVITKGGVGVHGAVIALDDAAGNIASGSVSRENGQYEISGLDPGVYQVRVSSLEADSADSITYLLRGRDIGRTFLNADTSFLPSGNVAVTIVANTVTAHNRAVTAGEPAFRITRVRPPNPEFVHSAENFPSSVRPGQSGTFVGVISANLPKSGATLSVTGGDVTLGPTKFISTSDGKLNIIYASIEVAADAMPGSRSYTVTRGSDLAFANGFLEILPPFRDFNFDGLDDAFQRAHFPLFTAAEAAPGSDPDGDGFGNRFEFTTGTNPKDRLSAGFQIQSVELTAGGSRVKFQSDAGRKFQLYGRPDVAGGQWVKVGSSITATGPASEVLDSAATAALRFYRVELLP